MYDRDVHYNNVRDTSLIVHSTYQDIESDNDYYLRFVS